MSYIVITEPKTEGKFDKISQAVEYAEENFEDRETFEINIVSDDGSVLSYDTIERNPYSKDFVYTAWGWGIDKYNDGEFDWQDGEFNTPEELVATPEFIEAKRNGYGLSVKAYTQTLYETIGDEVDTYDVE